MSEKTAESGGIGLSGATFLVLMVLKLVGVVDWSWWWIFAPLWIPAGLLLIILLVAIAIASFVD